MNDPVDIDAHIIQDIENSSKLTNCLQGLQTRYLSTIIVRRIFFQFARNEFQIFIESMPFCKHLTLQFVCPITTLNLNSFHPQKLRNYNSLSVKADSMQAKLFDVVNQFSSLQTLEMEYNTYWPLNHFNKLNCPRIDYLTFKIHDTDFFHHLQ